MCQQFWSKILQQGRRPTLNNALNKHYDITTDWTGKNYCGLTIEWNYQQGYVDVSMPGYVVDVLLQFQNTKPKQYQHSPHQWNQPVFGQRVQYANQDTSSKLDKLEKKKHSIDCEKMPLLFTCY